MEKNLEKFESINILFKQRSNVEVCYMHLIKDLAIKYDEANEAFNKLCIEYDQVVHSNDKKKQKDKLFEDDIKYEDELSDSVELNSQLIGLYEHIIEILLDDLHKQLKETLYDE